MYNFLCFLVIFFYWNSILWLLFSPNNKIIITVIYLKFFSRWSLCNLCEKRLSIFLCERKGGFRWKFDTFNLIVAFRTWRKNKMRFILWKLDIKPERRVLFFVEELRFRVKLLVVKFGRSSVLVFSVEKAFITVKNYLISFL